MSGIARSALVVLAPVKAAAREQLMTALEKLGSGDESPFGRVPGTHVARWAVIPALKGPDSSPLDSEGAFLLLCADFDATPEEWAAALCKNAGPQLDSVMCHCEGFPGSAHPGQVAAYFASHNAAPGFTIAGYRQSTVGEICRALGLREALHALAVRSQRGEMDPAELRRAWKQATGR